MTPCRHGRYLVEYLYDINVWNTNPCIVWQCIRCGSLIEKNTIGKSTEYQIVGYDPRVHVCDVWSRR